MARTYLDIHGKVKFIHAVNLNKYGKWSITIYPDAKSLEKIRELQADGLKNILKKDQGDPDGYYISFHREPTKPMRGKVVAFPAPVVIDKDGQPMDGSTIGWGSDVTVRVEIYRSTPASQYKYVACRWDKLRVDNHIPFSAEKQLPPMEAAEMKSMAEAEEPEPW